MTETGKEHFADWVTERLYRRHSRSMQIRTFAAGFVGNLICWITPFITPEIIKNAISTATGVESKVALWLLLIPFSCVFVMVFSLTGLSQANMPEIVSHGQVLSGYAGLQQRERSRNKVLISSACGALNCILLFFVVT